MYKRVCDAVNCNSEQIVNRYRDVDDPERNTWIEISRHEQNVYNDADETDEVIVEGINLIVCSPECGVIVMEGLQ